MTIRHTYLLLIAIALAMMVTSGITQAAPETNLITQQPSSTQLPTGTVQATVVPSQTTNSVSALGSIESATVVTLYFQTSGTVKGVYVHLGDSVQANEVLADLDVTDAWNSYNKAVLNREKAQLALDALYEPPTEEDIRTAKANVASAQAAYSAAANTTSSAEVQSAQLSYQKAQQNLEGLKAQRAHMDGTDEEIALQEAKIGEASFNAEIARLQLVNQQKPDSASLWQASAKIQQQQLQLDKLQAGPTQAEIDNAQITLQTAQASVQDAETTLRHMQLVAPISGTVTAINISARDSVGQTVAAIEISDFSHLRITVPINELDIAKVKVGASAEIKIDAISGLQITGKVENVGWLSSKSSDGIVTYDVQVAFDTLDERVRIGMSGEVTIDTGSAS